MEKISVIKTHDKWGSPIFRAEDGTIESAALILLAERAKQGFWYDFPETAQGEAERIVSEKNGSAAWRFLCERRDYEYEYVEGATI